MRAWSSNTPEAESGAVAKAIAPREQAGEYVLALLLISSDSLATTTRTHAHTGEWCHAVACVSRPEACLQAACRADERGMGRHMQLRKPHDLGRGNCRGSASLRQLCKLACFALLRSGRVRARRGARVAK